MKLEPWVPSFMRKIATIWNAEHSEHRSFADTWKEDQRARGHSPPYTFVYGVQSSAGVVEVKSRGPLPYGKLLRIEDE